MWEDGEPNNLRYLEPCVVANTEAPYKQPIKLSWNDKYCLGHHDYVCQIPTGGFDLKQANRTLCRLIKYSHFERTKVLSRFGLLWELNGAE